MNDFTFHAKSVGDVATLSVAISSLGTPEDGIDETRLTIVSSYGNQADVVCRLETEMSLERVRELMTIAETDPLLSETLKPLGIKDGVRVFRTDSAPRSWPEQ